MDQLISCLKQLRAKLERLKEPLKETPTRTIIIDPILEALGWDVRDTDIVQLEYPTIDGKSVDYALKINEKVVLMVEAKPLADPLDDVKDVKAITQVVGYSANAGIDWCILTNGIAWKVYRSSEKCPAPDKLLFEVTYNPTKVTDENLPRVAESFWKFSRDEMAKGRLDREGERVFNDGKVRKVLDRMVQDPPRSLLQLIEKEMGSISIPRDKIKESLYRIWFSEEPSDENVEEKGIRRTQKVHAVDETHHLREKSNQIREMYRQLDQFCMGLGPDAIQRAITRLWINYKLNKKIFCSVVLRKSGLKVYLPLRSDQLQTAPPFARDVSRVGHWGVGDLELTINQQPQLQEAFELIKQSFMMTQS